MPHLVAGDQIIDERGTVRFVNDFDFKNVKRFYQVENHRPGFVRAWHGHKREDKYIYVARGAALIGAVDLATEEIQRFVLSANKPRILWIPPNHANGMMSLQADTIIIIFSSLSLEDSQQDDIRFPYDKWNIWDTNYQA